MGGDPLRQQGRDEPQALQDIDRFRRGMAVAVRIDGMGHAGVTLRVVEQRCRLSDDARYVTGHTLMADGGSCPVT